MHFHGEGNCTRSSIHAPSRVILFSFSASNYAAASLFEERSRKYAARFSEAIEIPNGMEPALLKLVRAVHQYGHAARSSINRNREGAIRCNLQGDPKTTRGLGMPATP
jgi:hypothetical protein